MPIDPQPLEPELRVLVVHDDPSVAAAIARTARAAHVGSTDHGDVAVREAAAFDAIVVDLEREPVDGWFLLARLAPIATPVVALGTHRHTARATALGAVAVVRDAANVVAVLRPVLAA